MQDNDDHSKFPHRGAIRLFVDRNTAVLSRISAPFAEAYSKSPVQLLSTPKTSCKSPVFEHHHAYPTAHLLAIPSTSKSSEKRPLSPESELSEVDSEWEGSAKPTTNSISKRGKAINGRQHSRAARIERVIRYGNIYTDYHTKNKTHFFDWVIDQEEQAVSNTNCILYSS
jgi:hypothetical protein